MAEGRFSLERELEAEIREFELRMARLDGQLDEKRSLLERLRQSGQDSQPPAPASPAVVAAPEAASPATPAPASAAAGAPAALETPAAANIAPEAHAAAQPTPAPTAAAPPSQDRVSGGTAAGRHSISALGKHHYEVDGLRFPNAGQMLDHLDVPHYFSRKYPKQGDAAAREVMRWARRNPELAAGVAVVLADGTRMGLDAAVNEIWR